MFGDGMPNALHCNKTDDSTSRVTLDGGIPTNDGFTINNIRSHMYASCNTLSVNGQPVNWLRLIIAL